MKEGAGFKSVKFALYVQPLEDVPPSTYQNEFINIEDTERAACGSHILADSNDSPSWEITLWVPDFDRLLAYSGHPQAESSGIEWQQDIRNKRNRTTTMCVIFWEVVLNLTVNPERRVPYIDVNASSIGPHFMRPSCALQDR